MRRSYFLKASTFTICFLLAMVWQSHRSAAQLEEEMRILRMFYREKELVVSPTRHPKSISQVAENITVVSEKQIKEMNAHTVAEVLNRVPGLFISFAQGLGSFGSTSLISIQGSEPRHVLVLVDGFPWNFLNSGAAETNSIPAGIIDRIEVIKGPASSAWGSSLGGVVNIITKPAGSSKKPAGSIRASYGEKNARDYRAEVSGRSGSLGYYLFAGSQDSDGLMTTHDFDNESLYSKFKVAFSNDMNLDLTLGYSEPHMGLGDHPTGDITSSGDSRTFFATASLDAPLTGELSLKGSLHRFNQKSVVRSDALGSGSSGPAGALYKESVYDEKTTGGSGKLLWKHGIHTAVFGLDFDRGKLDQVINAGPFLQSKGVPERSAAHPDIERWAIYANDTIVIDRWSITPGIRYDHTSITGSFTSPSLGVTYRPGKDSILRASVARGFTMPPLSWTSGGALFLDPNPSLDYEKVWSYQAGVESAAFKYLWIKASLFRHDLKNALIVEPFGGGPPTFNDRVVNNGKIRREGFELEAETLPFHNLSLRGGLAYVDIDPANEAGAGNIYSYHIGARYNDRNSIAAELFGHYVWWDLDAAWMGSYDDFIWDFNLNKKIWSKEKTSAEVFFSARNIFKGSQYTFCESKNPGRWVEAGIRFAF